MTTTSIFRFSILMSLFLVSFFGVEGKLPPSCKHYECPAYDVIQAGNKYEIRRYNSPVWISKSVQDTSLVGATTTGFHRLFSYIHGNNNYKKKIKITAPVTSEVLVRGEKSSIVVSLYVPKENQIDPPPADGLYVQRWKTLNVAVRQFGGFVTSSNVKKQVAALNTSIAGTKWSATIVKSFVVAQYNSPFELFNRVNEIWFLYE